MFINSPHSYGFFIARNLPPDSEQGIFQFIRPVDKCIIAP